MNQKQWNQQARAVRNQVRGRYNHLFTPAWYARHPNAWRWNHPHANVWAAAVAWPVLANWVGVNTASPYYTGTMYESDTYYVTEDGTPAGESTEETLVEQYPESAAELAASGYSDNPNTDTDSNHWLPLGVYTITPVNTTTTPYRVFQFAVNKDGVVRGSYYDALTGQTAPIQGAVSKTTQQVAWTVGKDGSVMETNLDSFTQDQSTVLIHQDSNQTDQWMMVRLHNPTTQSTTNTQTNPQTGNQTGTQTGTQTGSQTGTNQNQNQNTNTNDHTTNGTTY